MDKNRTAGAKHELKGTVKELKNGSKAAQGQCSVCGTKMTRMLPKSAQV